MRMSDWSSLPPDLGNKATFEAHNRLTPIWSRVMLSGWLLMVLALAAVGSSSHVIGRPVFWLDDQRWTLPGSILMTVAVAIPIAATLLVCYLRGPWVAHLSSIATVEITLLAFFDRDRSPGAAVVLAVLAIAAMLFSAAAFAGTYRRRDTSTSQQISQ